MGLALRDQERHTYGDYLTWTDETRYELIEGAAYAMTPAPTVLHQEILGALYRQVADALEDSPYHVLAGPVDVLLPKAEESDEAVDTVVQPDLLVVCDLSKVGEKRVRGAPDWVVEVLSPSTAGHDHLRKRQIYERQGVREYWLVHPVDRVLLAYRLEIRCLRKADRRRAQGTHPRGRLAGGGHRLDPGYTPLATCGPGMSSLSSLRSGLGAGSVRPRTKLHGRKRWLSNSFTWSRD